MSGWQDSNLRPSAPKADAIPGYATPRSFFNSFLERVAKVLLFLAYARKFLEKYLKVNDLAILPCL
jgi:hypothetical protein